MNLSKNYSNEILAGQRLIVGIHCTILDDKTKSFLKETSPCGIILFSRNIETPDQLLNLNRDIISFFEDMGLPSPFISIDQEGGVVARLKKPLFHELPSIAEISSIEEARHHAAKMSELLTQYKFNMNMAPVLDVASLNQNSIMKERSFKGDIFNVAELGCVMVDEYRKNGIAAVGKHFPGIGNTTLDSHECLPVYREDEKELIENDIYPFKKAIEKNIPALMFSHILYSKIDSTWPASISHKICKRILRENLSYENIAMTDDLDMKAITSPVSEIADQMIKADMDIALICHDLDKAKAIHGIFLNEIKNKGESTIKSAERVLRIKKEFCLI